jgi:branched-chain amino acid transport system substrate-binding protein
MKKYLSCLALILILGMALCLLFLSCEESSDAIKIGAIIPLSGAGAYYGEEARDGMLMAIDEINSLGGVNNKRIELLIEDSKSDPGTGRKGFIKLEEAHKPLFFVSVLSSVSTAVSDEAEKSNVVLFSLITADPEITKNKEWTFRIWLTTEYEVSVIDRIVDKLKIKGLGILYLDDEYGRSALRYMKENMQKHGGGVTSEPFKSGDTDFKSQVKKLQHLQAVFIVGYTSHLINIVRELRKENYNGHIITSNGASTSDIRRLADFNGVYLAAPLIYNPDFLLARKLKEEYEKRYGKPFSHFAANCYDCIILVANLLEDQEISRKNLKTRLEQGFIHPGVFGDIDVKAGQKDIPIPLYPARILNGELDYWE